MDFSKIAILYFSTLIFMFAVDLVWIGIMNSRFYKPQLARLMGNKVKWLPGILFYMLFVAGLLTLAVMPAVDSESWSQAALLGGLLGMVSFATYDLSNLATLKDWPVIVTVVDIVWGTVFSATVATISYLIASTLL